MMHSGGLVYFSSVLEEVRRFVRKPDMPAVRIRLRQPVEVDGPCARVLPTYGGGYKGPDVNAVGYVPKRVTKFLDNEHNRMLLRGVTVAGNNNFDADFAMPERRVSRECGVASGEDAEIVGARLADFWKEETCHHRSQLQSL